MASAKTDEAREFYLNLTVKYPDNEKSVTFATKKLARPAKPSEQERKANINMNDLSKETGNAGSKYHRIKEVLYFYREFFETFAPGTMIINAIFPGFVPVNMRKNGSNK
jgi:hypothetical protein